MSNIKLDPKKLLGFRIISDGSVAKMSSSKVGGKVCVSADVLSENAGALGAKIGTKSD